MIKNLIFDFGGVLCDLDFKRCMNAFAQLGFPEELMTAEVISSGIFQQYNVGVISEADFFRQLRQFGNVPSATDKQLLDTWNSIIVSVPPQRFKALETLGKTYDLYLLSNTNASHWEYCLRHVWNHNGKLYTQCFKEVFLSYEMHKEKPNRDIFEEVIQRTGVKPDESLFIDDIKENVRTAEAVGLHALQALGDEWIDKIVGKQL